MITYYTENSFCTVSPESLPDKVIAVFRHLTTPEGRYRCQVEIRQGIARRGRLAVTADPRDPQTPPMVEQGGCPSVGDAASSTTHGFVVCSRESDGGAA